MGQVHKRDTDFGLICIEMMFKAMGLNDLTCRKNRGREGEVESRVLECPKDLEARKGRSQKRRLRSHGQ